MAVDDDILIKNPFDFQLANVLINDSVTREAITKEQMNSFLKFIKDDNVYWKYYDVVYILFHTGMRISEFCGLTLNDIDLEKGIVNIDHQLLRDSNSNMYIQSTKTNAGTRKLPIKEDVKECFERIIEDRPKVKCEKMIDGYTGFLCLDRVGEPLVAMHWQNRFSRMVGRYNSINLPKLSISDSVIAKLADKWNKEVVSPKRGVYKSYVEQTIIRYAQNCQFWKKKFSLTV